MLVMNSPSFHDFDGRLMKEISSAAHINVESILQVLKDLLRSCQGKIISSQPSLNSVVQLSHVKDIRVKKLVHLYLSFLTEKDSEIWLQVTNSISNDLADPNPSVRQAALLFLTDSHSVSSSVNDIRVDSVMQCLADDNPSVRRSAVCGTSKLFELFSAENIKHDMSPVLQQISKMIYSDEDPAVIIECVYTLQACQKLGVKTELLLSLLERLDLVEDWMKSEIVSLFTRFTDPSKMTHEEIFQVLNFIDPYLDKKYPVFLTLTCIAAMLHVSGQFSNIHSDVSMRIVKFLLSELKVFPQNTKSVYLAVLNAVVSRLACCEVKEHYKNFLLLATDSAFVKVQKLKLLQKVCCEETASTILQQAVSCCLTAKVDELKSVAVETIYHTHKYLPEQCGSLSTMLFQHDDPIVLDAVVILVKRIKVSRPQQEITAQVEKMVSIYGKLSSSESKCAYLWLVSTEPRQHYVKMLSAIMTTEEVNWSSNSSTALKFTLLRTVMVFYFIAPKTFLKVLGRFLQKASQEPDLSLNRRAVFYYNLLKHDTTSAKQMVTYHEAELVSDEKYVNTSFDKNLNRLDLLTFEKSDV